MMLRIEATAPTAILIAGKGANSLAEAAIFAVMIRFASQSFFDDSFFDDGRSFAGLGNRARLLDLEFGRNMMVICEM